MPYYVCPYYMRGSCWFTMPYYVCPYYMRGSCWFTMPYYVCPYYMRGTCWFGPLCWYSHDLGTYNSQYNMNEADTSAEEINFVVGARRETTPMTASPNRSNSGPRQTNQVLPNSANKSSVTHETASSAPKMNDIKTVETRAGSPDSVLVETVKKLNEAENLVVSLCEQLHVKSEEDNFSWVQHQLEQYLKSDLQCNICYEIFIEPTVLSCSHTFCHECIESWTLRDNSCPTCRASVRNKSYCLTVDNFLDKIADCLPDEIKTRRESLKVERNNNKDRDEWDIAMQDLIIEEQFGINRDDRDDRDDELSDDTSESVKDRVSTRLIETKWVDKVENLINVALQKRNEGGQDSTTVKFEELYQDVCEMARGMCL